MRYGVFAIGIGWLLISIIGVIWPKFSIVAKTFDEAKRRGTLSRCKLCLSIAHFAFAALLIGCSFISNTVVFLLVLIPVFIVILTFILISNWKNFGRLRP